MTTTLTDETLLTGATMRGRALRVYDDGFGPLWIYSESLGPLAVIRAQTWEDAWGIAEDEIMDEAAETVDELVKEYGFRREHRRVVRDASVAEATEHTGVGERFVRDSDYVSGRLPDGMFVRWQTVETPDPDAWIENELFCEAFGFRPNGANARDLMKHGIYSKDLNHQGLSELTPELAAELGIEIQTAP